MEICTALPSHRVNSWEGSTQQGGERVTPINVPFILTTWGKKTFKNTNSLQSKNPNPCSTQESLLAISFLFCRGGGDFLVFMGTAALLSCAALAVDLQNLQEPHKRHRLLDLRSHRKSMGRNDEIPAAAWRQVMFWGMKRKETSFGSFYP